MSTLFFEIFLSFFREVNIRTLFSHFRRQIAKTHKRTKLRRARTARAPASKKKEPYGSQMLVCTKRTILPCLKTRYRFSCPLMPFTHTS